jgi:very-short-patch-repair endonuclease
MLPIIASIDRKLQELGFKVLRYRGKAINEEMAKVISEIKSWVDKASYDRS